MSPMKARDRFHRRPSAQVLRLGLALVVASLFMTVLASPGWPPVAAQEATDAEAPAEAEQGGDGKAAGKVVAGKIDSDIGLAESAFVKRLLEEAAAQQATAVALELNTFGGRVDAAVLIRDALLDAPIPTVVFINKRAISAGALISLACKKIAISPGGTIGAATPINSTPGQELPEAVEEKYLSYFRQEMRVTAETNGRNGDIAEAMVDADKEVPGVSEAGKLVTLTTQSALEHGFADVEAHTLTEALTALGFTGEVVEVERSWSESLVGFLTSQTIASLLFLGMMVLAYLEYHTPGFGVFGFGAICCFLLLYFSHYLVNLAGWEELLLFTLGVVLLVVELVALPGFGLIGIAGFVCILGSAVLLLMAGDWSDFTFSNPFTREAVARVTFTLLLSVLAIGALFRYLVRDGRGPLGRRLVLAQGLTRTSGYESHGAASDDLVGQSGPALTPLRPAGKARIAGQRLNVETEGDFVDPGEVVQVLRREPGRIVVRRTPAPLAAAAVAVEEEG